MPGQRMLPTAEELWNTEFFQKHLATALMWALESTESDLLSGVECAMRDSCESPLEAAFLAWWYAMSLAHHGVNLWPHPQRTVTLNGQEYRLDYVLEPSPPGDYDALNNHPLKPKIAIELDGHDFHERTKEQVTWRNIRDRALEADGWTVWHFSGSEFHRDPKRVVYHEVYLRASTRFADAMREAGFWRRFNLDTGGTIA